MPKKIYTTTILGAGNMGTAMAKIIGENGHQVKLWNYEGDLEPLTQIQRYHENKKYLPGVILPTTVTPITDLSQAIKNSVAIFFVLPSHVISTLLQRIGPLLTPKTICVDVSKGLTENTQELIPNLIKKNIPVNIQKFVVSISGPAIAVDVANGGFTAMNIAGQNNQTIAIIKNIVESKKVKLFTTTDMIGVEVAGSFKNVYAIILGVCDGLHLPLNTKAALLVIALQEIGDLIHKMGGKKETAFDLAGLGDLIGTALSPSSRNRRLGEFLANGLSRTAALAKIQQVVEGINAVKTMMVLEKKYKLHLPLAKSIYRIVWQAKNPARELNHFLQRL